MGLVINPTFYATAREKTGGAEKLGICSLRRGRGPLEITLLSTQSTLFELANLAVTLPAGTSAEGASLDSDQIKMLALLGGLVPEAESIGFHPFHAPLNVAPATTCHSGALHLTGQLLRQDDDRVPEIFRAIVLQRMISTARPILWHRRDPNAPLALWWPDTRCLDAIRALQSGKACDDGAALTALAAAGIVAEPNAEAERISIVDKTKGAYATSLSADGFVRIEELIVGGQLEALGAFYRNLVAMGVMKRGDTQSDRFVTYSDPVAHVMHHALLPMIELIARTKLKPSYTYVGIYNGGAELPPHTDRRQCEYTLSLQVYYDPEPLGPTPWPLYIYPIVGDQPVEVYCALGDAVLFRGRKLSHARPRLTPDHRSCTLLLHYVDAAYEGSLR